MDIHDAFRDPEPDQQPCQKIPRGKAKFRLTWPRRRIYYAFRAGRQTRSSLKTNSEELRWQNDSALINREHFPFTSQELWGFSFPSRSASRAAASRRLCGQERRSRCPTGQQRLTVTLQSPFPRERSELQSATCWPAQNTCRRPQPSLPSHPCREGLYLSFHSGLKKPGERRPSLGPSVRCHLPRPWLLCFNLSSQDEHTQLSTDSRSDGRASPSSTSQTSESYGGV